MNRLKVMIAGVGGASLGTEILKSLKITNRYDIFGCDISPTAYPQRNPPIPCHRVNIWPSASNTARVPCPTPPFGRAGAALGCQP